MSLKQQILNKIKSINDPEVLRELDEWISEREREAEKTGTVNESGKSYKSLPSKKRSKAGERSIDKSKEINATGSAIDCLEKIAASGGVKEIEDPVDWQRKERCDRTLTTSYSQII